MNLVLTSATKGQKFGNIKLTTYWFTLAACWQRNDVMLTLGLSVVLPYIKNRVAVQKQRTLDYYKFVIEDKTILKCD